MKRTYKERLEAGLKSLGWVETHTKSGMKAWSQLGHNGFLFVGPAGGLRSGVNISNSHSVGDPQRQTGFYAKVLSAGDNTLGQTATRKLDDYV